MSNDDRYNIHERELEYETEEMLIRQGDSEIAKNYT